MDHEWEGSKLAACGGNCSHRDGGQSSLTKTWAAMADKSESVGDTV